MDKFFGKKNSKIKVDELLRASEALVDAAFLCNQELSDETLSNKTVNREELIRAVYSNPRLVEWLFCQKNKTQH